MQMRPARITNCLTVPVSPVEAKSRSLSQRLGSGSLLFTKRRGRGFRETWQRRAARIDVGSVLAAPFRRICNMIPSTFSPAWRAAIERGDASHFESQADLTAFFRATSMIGGCFLDLPESQRDKVVGLRERFPAAIAEARTEATREREVADVAPRFIGRTNTDLIPTLADLKPELIAIEAEIGKVAPPIPSAKDIYARRAKARGAWDEVIAVRNAKFDAFLNRKPG